MWDYFIGAFVILALAEMLVERVRHRWLARLAAVATVVAASLLRLALSVYVSVE